LKFYFCNFKNQPIFKIVRSSIDSLLYKDFTIKARLDNVEKMEKVLFALKAEYIGEDFQVDHYFQTEKGRLKWREGTIENLITHYERFHDLGLERTTVYRYDLNPSAEQIQELEQKHKLVGVITKQRKIYQLLNVKIHLDKLPSGEEFIEIEAIDRDNQLSVDKLRKQCLEVKSKLHIRESDLIQTGYLKEPNV
jgi:adenylate cyclase class 2